jgi:hypothetical protein
MWPWGTTKQKSEFIFLFIFIYYYIRFNIKYSSTEINGHRKRKYYINQCVGIKIVIQCEKK